MIEAQHLKIGNLVYVKSTDQLGVVTCINKHVGLAVNDSFVYLSFEDCDGIPITEDILLKLGFRKFCKDFAKKDIILHTRKRGFIIKKSIPQMKTVHQLQNYYYANKGEELPTDKILNS